MRRLLGLSLVCIAAAATGCGGDGSGMAVGSDEDQVRATLSALADADRTGDYNRFCELLSTASVRVVLQLGGGSDCPAALRSTAGAGHTAASVATLAATDISVTGDRAVARIPNDGNAVPLVREDGNWRVEMFGRQTPTASAHATAPQAAPAAGPARHDSGAKSDVRNAVSHMESCFTDTNTYVGCQPNHTAAPGGGLVEVRTATATTYEVVARTAAGNEYRMLRGANGMFQRTCAVAAATTSCADGTW